MSLLTIAELLAGEAAVTPGGPVDRATATGDDRPLWMRPTDDTEAVPELAAAADVEAPESHPVLATV